MMTVSTVTLISCNPLLQLTSYFDNLFHSSGVNNVDAVLNKDPQRVTTDINDHLCCPYSTEEV